MARSTFLCIAFSLAICSQPLFADDSAAPAAQAPASTKPAPLGELAEPKCPPQLQGKQCDAVVTFVVGTDGKTSGIEIVSASHPDWGKAVAKAVAKWRFTPGTRDGKPVPTKMTLPIGFEVSITAPARTKEEKQKAAE